MTYTNPPASRAKAFAYIDYRPAELRKNKDWVIVYYARNPFTRKMELIRIRAPKLRNQRDRERHANKIVTEINRKLSEGWSPFLESTSATFKPFTGAIDQFLLITDKEIKDGIKREDTRRTYDSFLNMLRRYIEVKKVKITFAMEIDKAFVINYLDWIYIDRQNSPRTYNNHLAFLRTFCNFLIDHGYLKENPTLEIPKKRNNKKKRQVIPPKYQKLLAMVLPDFNYGYYVMCMLEYYCLIRRTELTKLKICHLRMDQDHIVIPQDIGKTNKYEEHVTMPVQMQAIIASHIADAAPDDLIFSDCAGFKPGKDQLKPKKISDTWDKVRKLYGLPDELQFYSFKDSGITDLFNLGVPALKIRDQARHKDLKTTQMYTPITKAGDEALRSSGLLFGEK